MLYSPLTIHCTESLWNLSGQNQNTKIFLVVRLGGLHTSLKCMHVIGKHVQSSGLEQAWIDSNSFGPRTAEQVLSDKSYAIGMRIHKQTMQATWRILIPKLFRFIRDRDQDLEKQIREKLSSNDTDELITALKTNTSETHLIPLWQATTTPASSFGGPTSKW